MRGVVSKAETEVVIRAFILSHSKMSFNGIHTVQNDAARLYPILSALHCLLIKFRIHFKILVLTFKALHGYAPLNFADVSFFCLCFFFKYIFYYVLFLNVKHFVTFVFEKCCTKKLLIIVIIISQPLGA